MVKSRYHNEFHSYLEAMAYLHAMVNRDLDEEIQFLEDKFPGHRKEVAAMFKPIQSITKAYPKKFKAYLAEIEFLFVEQENDLEPLYELFIYNFKSEEINDNDICRAYSEYFSLDDQLKSREEIKKHLHKADITIHQQANLLYIMENYHSLLANMKNYVAIINKLLVQTVKEYQKELALYLTEIKDIFKNDDIAKVFKEINIPVYFTDDKIIDIYPGLTYPNAINMFASADDITIRFGIGVLEVNKMKGKREVLDRRQLTDILKILSDETKFQIMELLKTKKMYGHEISQELDLATSTISYHVNMLVNIRLVNLIKVGKKIYYEVNREVLDDYLKQIRKQLFD